ncbi:MAG: crotonase/enoyl-CoA hydratase family protein [Rhodocyclaceae bacterium]|nr:crotonase/enoyl-CoA hydratase family protein [Rhodocyclaceae bacterium]
MNEILTSLDAGVAHIRFNRSDKANALNASMWQGLRQAMQWLDETPAARVGILSAAGTHFSAGIDLQMLGELRSDTADPCAGRSGEKLRRSILDIQDTVTAIERCRKPVIAAIHGACIGGGIDIVTACDMRYCSASAGFSVKEIDVGLVADVGTLQRLPRLIGEGKARELAYTGARLPGSEAERIGLVNRCYETNEDLTAGVEEVARLIAAKSPLSIRGTKEMITYVRDHSVSDGLNYVATWNAAMLFSEDLDEALLSFRESRGAVFRD